MPQRDNLDEELTVRENLRRRDRFAQLRGAVYSAAFLVVMAAMGYLRSWWALLALPAVVLVGLAFAGVGMAATTWMRSWQDFDLITVATLPMFLFSGTFAPLSSYPTAVPVGGRGAAAAPCGGRRPGLCLGMPDVGMLWHLGYLVRWGCWGWRSPRCGWGGCCCAERSGGVSDPVEHLFGLVSSPAARDVSSSTR